MPWPGQTPADEVAASSAKVLGRERHLQRAVNDKVGVALRRRIAKVIVDAMRVKGERRESLNRTEPCRTVTNVIGPEQPRFSTLSITALVRVI
jgi:hypothetical protein